MPTVKEIMTKHTETCKMDHPVRCTLQIMREKNVGAVPIVDHQDHVIGIVTDRDIALKILETDKPVLNMSLSDIVPVQKRMITVHPDEDLAEAVAMMEEHQIRRLPVVDQQDVLVGLLSQADIARTAKTQLTGKMLEGVSKIKERTIGANP